MALQCLLGALMCALVGLAPGMTAAAPTASDLEELLAAKTAAAACNATLNVVLATLANVEAEQRHMRAEIEALKIAQKMATGRRLQDNAASADDVVHIFRRSISTADFVDPYAGQGLQPPANNPSPAPGPPAVDGGKADTGGGKRRVQTLCGSLDLPPRLSALASICCDEPGEDCGSGYPTVCNEGCAAGMAAFWADCAESFVATSTPEVVDGMRAAVNLCEAAASDSQGYSLAELFDLTCTDGIAQEACVPACEASTHGHVLLATIDGDDCAFDCHLRHGLYSWAGSRGGYIGSDIRGFVSSVLDGYGGAFFLHVEENYAAVAVDLVVEQGQTVRISGDVGVAEDGGPAAPTWGSGNFIVRAGAELALTNLLLDASTTIIFAGNGSMVSLTDLALPSDTLTSMVQSLALTSETMLKLSRVDGRTGTIVPDGLGGTIASGLSGVFAVTSGPCTTTQGGRCVGRRYDESARWVSNSEVHGQIAEQCEIVVLGAGQLGSSPLFDTVSYSASTGVENSCFLFNKSVVCQVPNHLNVNETYLGPVGTLTIRCLVCRELSGPWVVLVPARCVGTAQPRRLWWLHPRLRTWLRRRQRSRCASKCSSRCFVTLQMFGHRGQWQQP